VSEALADAAARERIHTDTASTLFVNAGAGSGKTAALVDRVVTLVLADGVAMRHIAAVTFTERAGAELRDRLRERFEAAYRDEAGELQERAEDALNDLDGAAIGTLHAFAQRILMEHPIEAGLPPRIEVLDEVGSSVAFDESWDALRVALLDDDTIAEPLLTGLAVGMKVDHARTLAQLLTNDWDLIEDRVLARPAPPYAPPDLTGFLTRAHTVLGLRGRCSYDGDLLLAKLDELAELVADIEQADDVDTRLKLLTGIAELTFAQGRKGNWGGDIESVRSAALELVTDAAGVLGEVQDQCVRQVTTWVAGQVLDAARRRRAEGSLVFHDLLVLARDLLRRHADVRQAIHERYQRILLDEFQDTDPIQIELAVRIAAGAPATQVRWQDVEVPPGRLFVVGDPKQSIYRFRRASIATYLDAEQHIGDTVSLTTNFRTVAPVLDWVNVVFEQLIRPEAAAQPAYERLTPFRPGIDGRPSVSVLGATPHEDLPRAAAAQLRRREAADAAAAVRQVVTEGWPVQDSRTGQWRPARLGDVVVLIPARTSLDTLEDALTEAGVPYRTEASSLVYAAEEVRSLLACARAVADTSDSLALVQALRSSVFGCGDDDLWRWKQAGGGFVIHSRLEEGHPLADGPVGSALGYLRRLERDARWLTPSELLGRIVLDRRMLEVAAGRRRYRDSWRRLRFVVDQARAWSEYAHGGLRAYLAWALRQGQDTARVAEAVLPETDADAVRIMTVHAAKGLEFPVVVLSGLTSQPRRAHGVRILWNDDGYDVSLGKGVETETFAEAAPVDEAMSQFELYRLLYVAATRARDHLVVSLHRKAGSAAGTAAALLAEAGADGAGAHHLRPAATAPGATVEPTPQPPPEWAAWLAELTAVRERTRFVPVVSASGLEGTEPEVVLAEQVAAGRAASAAGSAGAPDEAASTDVAAGRAKGARDLQLPPWSKGRYGSAVGRAVHGVLQVVDLASRAGLEEAVAAQCLAEGVLGQQDLVRSLVESALASDLVRAAAEGEHWRETYVGVPGDDGTLLEGFIDLVYREDGRLVVVDYKTDAVPAGGIASRVTYYAPQLHAYRRALSGATGLPVTTYLLFLHPTAPATAVEVPA